MPSEIKYCQSCIERGYNPPNPATREWLTNVFYCDECFNALLENMTSISPSELSKVSDVIKDSNITSGPVLEKIYEFYNIPKELQFERIDTVQRNYDKIFNFHAPAIVNRSLESLAEEIEQLGMAIFHIKYRLDPLEMQAKKLKEERRKEKGLQSYDDSKEAYSKVKKTNVKSTQEEKMAKALNMTVEAYRVFAAESQAQEKKARERKFNVLAGNCPECGGSMPCIEHIGVSA